MLQKSKSAKILDFLNKFNIFGWKIGFYHSVYGAIIGQGKWCASLSNTVVVLFLVECLARIYLPAIMCKTGTLWRAACMLHQSHKMNMHPTPVKRRHHDTLERWHPSHPFTLIGHIREGKNMNREHSYPFYKITIQDLKFNHFHTQWGKNHNLPRIWCLKKCEFCEKWDFEIVNCVKNEILKMWIFG